MMSDFQFTPSVGQIVAEHANALAQTSFFPKSWARNETLKQYVVETLRLKLATHCRDPEKWNVRPLDRELKERFHDELSTLSPFPSLVLISNLGGIGACAFPAVNALIIHPEYLKLNQAFNNKPKCTPVEAPAKGVGVPDEVLASVLIHEREHLRGYKKWPRVPACPLVNVASGWTLASSAPSNNSKGCARVDLFSPFEEAVALSAQLEGLTKRNFKFRLDQQRHEVSIPLQSAAARELLDIARHLPRQLTREFLTISKETSESESTLCLHMRSPQILNEKTGEHFDLGYKLLIDNLVHLRSLLKNKAGIELDEELKKVHRGDGRQEFLKKLTSCLGPTASLFFSRLGVSEFEAACFRLYLEVDSLPKPLRFDLRKRLTDLVELWDMPDLTYGYLQFKGNRFAKITPGYLYAWPDIEAPHSRELCRLLRAQLPFLLSHGSHIEALKLGKYYFGYRLPNELSSDENFQKSARIAAKNAHAAGQYTEMSEICRFFNVELNFIERVTSSPLVAVPLSIFGRWNKQL